MEVMVSFTPWQLYPRGESPVPPGEETEWVGPKASLGAVEKRKKSLHCSCWESNPGRPDRTISLPFSQGLDITKEHTLFDGGHAKYIFSFQSDGELCT